MTRNPRLRLRAVQVSGVRGIGWGPDGGPGLDLPELGDVTILSGPNGLGKSSLMDALRLALMGDVLKHREALAWEHLCHRHQADLGVSVQLGFDDDSKVSWRAATVDDVVGAKQGALATVGALLPLSGDADDPTTVADHLRLTHFLPQGWGDRFTELDGTKDGWSLIEQALGIEGLRTAVTAFQGQKGVKGALTSLNRDAAAHAEEAQRAINDWSEAHRQWTDARSDAAVSGALDVESVRELLGDAAGILGIDIGSAVDGGIVLVDEAIIRDQAALETTRTRLDEAAELVAAWPELRAAVEERSEQSRRAQEAQVAQTRAHQVAIDLEKAARAWVAQLELPQLRQALESADEAQRSAELRQRTLTDHKRSLKLLDLASTADRLESERKMAEGKLAALGESDSLRQELDRDTAIHTERVSDLASAATYLNTLRDQHGQLVGLLQQLRPHVDRDGKKCPVCSAEYEAGELKERLEESLELIEDAAMQAAVAAHETAKRAASEAKAALTKTQTALDTLSETTRSLRATLEDLESRERRLRVDLPDELVETALAGLPPALRALAARLASDDVELQGPTLDAAIQRSRRAVAEATTASAGARQARDTTQVLADSWPAGGGNAPPDLTSARAQLATAEQDATDAAPALAAATAHLSQARLAESEATDARDRTAAAWRHLPMEGQPGSDTLDSAHATLRTRRARLQESTATLGAARKGASAWQSLRGEEQARFRLRKLAAESGGDVDDTPPDVWIARVSTQLKNKSDAAIRARAQREEEAKRLDGFIGKISAVLNAAGKDILPTIMKRQHAFQATLAPGVPWRLDAAKPRNKLGLSAGADNSEPVSQISRLLSEGEHTAVALSFLLALHTHFRWSRWPALILDDPFQAADVVRIAALLDVLRSVALHHGTQLIMTTHDLDRAQWIQRKMKNGGLHVQHYALHSGPHGVVASRA